MSIYKKYCTEVLDEQGNLQKFSLHYPENFNYGYDVVDAIAKVQTNRQDRPLTEQKIASITVETNGAAIAELKKLPDPYGRF